MSKHYFQVTYRLTGTEADCRAAAQEICVEQTIEFPADLVWKDEIREEVIARVVDFRQVDGPRWEADICYANDTVGAELTQLVNVIFGNISLKPGVRVARLELPDELLAGFPGPRFGRQGLRGLLGVPERPLICSALKPMGLSSAELAELASRFALGGIDLLKDDHGLTDQAFAPFKERVELCAAAVARANQETGGNCLYLPNVTGPSDQIPVRAHFAKDAGAGGLLIAPGLVGLDAMRMLAADDSLAMPLLAHPALLGSFVVNPDQGISHFALFGQIVRLAGGDGVIFPNHGGRFSFTREDCRSLVAGTREPMGALRSIFPVPAGGMTRERIPEMMEFYGRDVMLLIGGDLHRHPRGLVAACREFLDLVK